MWFGDEVVVEGSVEGCERKGKGKRKKDAFGSAIKPILPKF